MAFTGWDEQALAALKKRGITMRDTKLLSHAEKCAVPALKPEPQTETKTQQAVVRGFKMAWPEIYATGALFAVPNEGKRSKATASRMKAEGMVSGVADLILLWPVADYCGACVEMKAKGGKLRENQSDWLEQRRISGYATAVCYSVEESMQFFHNYLNDIR